MLDFDPQNTFNLNDEGTRYRHFTDLLDLWSEGLRILRGMNQDYLSELDKINVKRLEAGIALLEKQMEVMSGYGSGKWDMGRKISSIPKDPKMIEGGRGTPLINKETV